MHGDFLVHLLGEKEEEMLPKKMVCLGLGRGSLIAFLNLE